MARSHRNVICVVIVGDKIHPLFQAIKTSAELCSEWNIEDVELEYDEDDFSSLTSFKLFCDNIKPLVVADNAKITGHKLNRFLQAKYREFVMQVPPMERSNYDTAGVGRWHRLHALAWRVQCIDSAVRVSGCFTISSLVQPHAKEIYSHFFL